MNYHPFYVSIIVNYDHKFSGKVVFAECKKVHFPATSKKIKYVNRRGVLLREEIVQIPEREETITEQITIDAKILFECGWIDMFASRVNEIKANKPKYSYPYAQYDYRRGYSYNPPKIPAIHTPGYTPPDKQNVPMQKDIVFPDAKGRCCVHCGSKDLDYYGYNVIKCLNCNEWLEESDLIESPKKSKVKYTNAKVKLILTHLICSSESFARVTTLDNLLKFNKYHRVSAEEFIQKVIDMFDNDKNLLIKNLDTDDWDTEEVLEEMLEVLMDCKDLDPEYVNSLINSILTLIESLE